MRSASEPAWAPRWDAQRARRSIWIGDLAKDRVLRDRRGDKVGDPFVNKSALMGGDTGVKGPAWGDGLARAPRSHPDVHKLVYHDVDIGFGRRTAREEDGGPPGIVFEPGRARICHGQRQGPVRQGGVKGNDDGCRAAGRESMRVQESPRPLGLGAHGGVPGRVEGHDTVTRCRDCTTGDNDERWWGCGQVAPEMDV